MSAGPFPDCASSRILLIEPEAGGHHFVPYAAALTRAVAAAGYRPALLTTREATVHPAMDEFERVSRMSVPISIMPSIRQARSGSVAELLRAQFNYWLAVRRGLESLTASQEPALCVLLGLDSCDRAIAVLGSPCRGRSFIGLTIQAKHHWPSIGIPSGGRSQLLNRWTFARVMAEPDCLGVVSIDEALVDHESVTRRHSGRVWFVPDPGEVMTRVERDAARRALGIDVSRPVVLAYGGLDARKNIGSLLAAARCARSSPIVALVGRTGAEVSELEQHEDWRALRAEARIWLEAGFASLDREALWFCASDLVWVGYRWDFLGQSAVIPLAASAGVPLLGRRGGLIGRTIEAHGLGVVVDPRCVVEVASAIDAHAMSRRAGEFSDNLARFAETRSHAAHVRAWQAVIVHTMSSATGDRGGSSE